VLDAVARSDRGDSKLLDLLASLLEEVDQAKQDLRDKGYGCTGMGIRDTVGDVEPLQ
jgi:hypothetical protein